MPAYPVLVFQHHPREGPGRLGEAIERNGLRARVLEMWNGDRVPSTVSGYRALVVLGGPQAAYDAPAIPQLVEEMRAIREAHATRTPILGVCLGAQLMAHALGGRAYRGPKVEVGVTPLRLAAEARADKLFRHVADGEPVLQWHGDSFDLPPGGTLLASTDAYANQAFRLPHDAYGLQFHLEWDAATLAGVSADAEAELRRAGAEREKLLADAERASGRMAATAARVFDAFLTDCGCND